MSPPTALVIGAGIAGLAAAAALTRAGWTVELVERAPEPRVAGAALSLWPNAMAGLRRLGAAARIEADAAPIVRMLLTTREGGALIDRAVADAYLPTRALLQAALRNMAGDLAVEWAREAVELVSAERGEIGFAGGKRRSADLVVVADGVRSAIGRAITGTEETYRGYSGVVALSDAMEGDIPAGLAAEYWGRHERFGVFDLGGGRRYWFHMRTARIGEPAPTLGEIAARTAGWPAPVRDAVAATPAERLIPWPIHARSAPKRLARGRVVCVGDAGHAMEPNLGQGACQAIEDAAALGAAAIQTDDPADVPALFEAMRLPRVRQVVARAGEGGYAVHGPVVVQAAMRAALRMMPGALKKRAAAGVQTMPDY
ncbi:FAD-dependent monooxygenase [uncultured Sphingomonas sp.]|uniref:FAD-dependent monooxygenase n=1 Tax=uncultured Sphingomonas sp. TaxID=158754 RepID=UPI0035CAE977